MMPRHAIPWQSATNKSIEEIATTILQQIKPGRNNFLREPMNCLMVT